MNRAFLLGGLAVAVVFPLIAGNYWLYVVTIGLYYAMLSTSWAMLVGQVGLISFAHAAFAALGAYTSALLVLELGVPIPLGMAGALLMAGLIGLGLGTLTLRMRGPYLALTTLAFSELLRIFLTAEYDLTRGSLGLDVPIIANGDKRVLYYVSLALLLAVLVVLWSTLRTRWGLFFQAIREDEDGAAARGINTVRYRLYAFVITSAVAGLAGSLFAHTVGFISPRMATISEMGLILAMGVVGGLEVLIAAAGGAILLQVVSEFLRAYVEWRLALFGLLVILSLRFTPNGLLTTLYFRLRDRFRGRAPATPAGREGVDV